MELYCAFLNCFNLFPLPNKVGRGPATQTEFNSKLDGLAKTLKSIFSGKPPDIIGLCEVGDKTLGIKVGKLIQPGYGSVWGGDPDPGHTSQILLFNPKKLARTSTPEKSFRTPAANRPFWLAVELQFIQGSRIAFWAIINHWKSNYKSDPMVAEKNRKDTARELGDFYLTSARQTSEPVLMLGDFNCEPGDLPFQKLDLEKQSPSHLRSSRERLEVINARKWLCFYNPMWRLMTEPDHWEDAQKPGYKSPRVTGTHLPQNRISGWKMWDQVMLTKHLLKGKSVNFLEQRMMTVPPINGSSDHYGIGAVFTY